MVLTGGGSLCAGTGELCEEIFDLPVRSRYLPAGLFGGELLEPGQWATALGLAAWVARDAAVYDYGDENGTSGGWWGWLRGLFSGRRG